MTATCAASFCSARFRRWTGLWSLTDMIHTNVMYIFFYPTASLQLSAFPLWIINQSIADKKFMLLFKIGLLPLPFHSLMWRQCVNHYRRVRMESGKNRKVEESEIERKGSWHSPVGGGKINRRIDGRSKKLAVSDGEREKRSRGWGPAAPQITAQLVVGVSR